LYLATNGQASVNLSSLVNISDNCCQGNITSVPVATGNVLTFNCASAALNNGVTNVQLQVSDCHGNTSTVTVPVTVLDRRPPTVSTLSPTVYLDANGSASLSATALVNATDACGGLVYSPPSVSFNCFQCNQTVSVTVNVRDANGNDTSVVVPVLVRDTIRPVSTSVPSNITVCRTASQVVYVQPNGTDNCGTVSVNQVAGLPSGSNFPVGVTTNTFNLLDVCGNVTQVSFTVTVRSGVSITWIPSNRANCTTDSSFDLTGGRTGYAFSGSGVIGNRFYPRLASPGLVPVSWTYVDVNGCDTTATLFIDLISAPVNPTIDRISLTLLRTTLSWDRYQWYRGDYPIPGATNREFNVSEWGNYSCEVMSPGGCFRLSNVITLGVGVSVDGPDNSKLMIYPNPTKGILNLAFSSLEFGTLSASISDMTGREVYRTDISDPISQLNLQALAQGEYILTLTSRTGSARHRIQVKY
jgi:hypothetical protein